MRLTRKIAPADAEVSPAAGAMKTRKKACLKIAVDGALPSADPILGLAHFPG